MPKAASKLKCLCILIFCVRTLTRSHTHGHLFLINQKTKQRDGRTLISDDEEDGQCVVFTSYSSEPSRELTSEQRPWDGNEAQLAAVQCFSHSALREEPGPSPCSAGRTYENIPVSLMSACRSLRDRSNFAMLTFLLKFLINMLFTILPSHFCWLTGRGERGDFFQAYEGLSKQVIAPFSFSANNPSKQWLLHSAQGMGCLWAQNRQQVSRG